MLVRDPPGDEHDPGRLARLRNGYFEGRRAHLPVAHLRERLPCFVDAGRTTTNPCDVFLNFVPVRTDSDWFTLLAPYEATEARYYPLANRIGAPSRRFAAPLLFVSFIHHIELSGSVEVHSADEIASLGRAVAAEIQSAATAFAAAPAS
jgi:hypothetical protein